MYYVCWIGVVCDTFFPILTLFFFTKKNNNEFCSCYANVCGCCFFFLLHWFWYVFVPKCFSSCLESRYIYIMNAHINTIKQRWMFYTQNSIIYSTVVYIIQKTHSYRKWKHTHNVAIKYIWSQRDRITVWMNEWVSRQASKRASARDCGSVQLEFSENDCSKTKQLLNKNEKEKPSNTTQHNTAQTHRIFVYNIFL